MVETRIPGEDAVNFRSGDHGQDSGVKKDGVAKEQRRSVAEHTQTDLNKFLQENPSIILWPPEIFEEKDENGNVTKIEIKLETKSHLSIEGEKALKDFIVHLKEKFFMSTFECVLNGKEI